MKNTRVLLLTLSMFLSFGAYAENSSQETPTQTVKNITETKKEGRKKKAVMCEECGKPEAECECKDHDKEKEKKKK
jgi:hypothetical protein